MSYHCVCARDDNKTAPLNINELIKLITCAINPVTFFFFFCKLWSLIFPISASLSYSRTIKKSDIPRSIVLHGSLREALFFCRKIHAWNPVGLLSHIRTMRE